MAVIYFAYKLIFWYRFEVGMAPLVIGIFFFSAVQLFFTGILGEYIGAIHTQVLHRPLVTEAERINFDEPGDDRPAATPAETDNDLVDRARFASFGSLRQKLQRVGQGQKHRQDGRRPKMQEQAVERSPQMAGQLQRRRHVDEEVANSIRSKTDRMPSRAARGRRGDLPSKRKQSGKTNT